MVSINCKRNGVDLIQLNADEIKKILPHAYPSSLISSATVEMCKDGELGSIEAIYPITRGRECLKYNELLEPMAQTCAILGMNMFASSRNVSFCKEARVRSFYFEKKLTDKIKISASFIGKLDDSNEEIRRLICSFDAKSYSEKILLADATIDVVIASLKMTINKGGENEDV